MSDIDRKIAEWAGIDDIVLGPCVGVCQVIATPHNAPEQLHDWLLSPEGTIAILEAFLRDGMTIESYATAGRLAFTVWGTKTHAATFGELVYNAAVKYMEDSCINSAFVCDRWEGK